MRSEMDLKTVLNQFKCQIWGDMEYHNGALIVASIPDREKLDKFQRWFLRELGMTDWHAFVNFNLAPPSMRRRIAMLGFIHKRVLGECHPLVRQLLPMCPEGTPGRHSKSLVIDRVTNSEYEYLWDRSIYMYALMYNRLPQGFVDSTCVKTFQSRLTHLAKQRAISGMPNWRQAYQNCMDVAFLTQGM